MPRLRYLGHAHADSYAAADLDRRLRAGDEVDVSEVVALRLLSEHGGAFERVGSSGPMRSPSDRMVRAAPRGGLELGTVAELRAALDAGEHDHRLDAVDAAERAGRARVTALRAIQARRDELNGGDAGGG